MQQKRRLVAYPKVSPSRSVFCQRLRQQMEEAHQLSFRLQTSAMATRNRRASCLSWRVGRIVGSSSEFLRLIVCTRPGICQQACNTQKMATVKLAGTACVFLEKRRISGDLWIFQVQFREKSPIYGLTHSKEHSVKLCAFIVRPEPVHDILPPGGGLEVWHV